MEPPRFTPAQQALGLVVWILICFGVAAVGGTVTADEVPGWYAQLQKPAWTPPQWLFGPVWTVLYLMMAVSAWLVWRQAGIVEARLPLGLFLVQLLLNGLWSILFFGLRNPGAALVDIVLLWFAIVATLVVFWHRSRWAALLLVPYFAWVSFAGVLNAAIWQLNR